MSKFLSLFFGLILFVSSSLFSQFLSIPTRPEDFEAQRQYLAKEEERRLYYRDNPYDNKKEELPVFLQNVPLQIYEFSFRPLHEHNGWYNCYWSVFFPVKDFNLSEIRTSNFFELIGIKAWEKHFNISLENVEGKCYDIADHYEFDGHRRFYRKGYYHVRIFAHLNVTQQKIDLVITMNDGSDPPPSLGTGYLLSFIKK